MLKKKEKENRFDRLGNQTLINQRQVQGLDAENAPASQT